MDINFLESSTMSKSHSLSFLPVSLTKTLELYNMSSKFTNMLSCLQAKNFADKIEILLLAKYIANFI